MIARGLQRVFDLRPGEGRRVAWLYVLMFVGGSGTAWARSVVDAEFLHHVGVEALPWLLVSSALGSALAIALYGAFADRVSNGVLYAGINVVAAVAMAAALAFAGGPTTPAAYAVLAVVLAVSVDLGNLHWATYVNGFYDTQSAKRIFPIVTSAARMAAIFAGATTPLLTARMPLPAIVGLRVVTLVAAAAIALALPRLAPAETAPAPPRKRKAQRSYRENVAEGLRHIRGSRYLRAMALATLVMTVLISFATYRTSAVLVAELGSSKAIADFLGLLNTGTNLVMLPFFAIWLSRIIRRVGVGNAALIYPVGNGIFVGALAALPSVVTAGLEYFGRTTFRLTFQFTVDGLLFNAVPLHVRARARAFIVGLLVPAGVLAGGGALFLLKSAPGLLAALLIAGACLYAAAMLRVRSEYGRALLAMLEAQDYSSLLSEPASDLATSDRATIERVHRRFVENADQRQSPLFAELYARCAGAEAIGPLARAAVTAKDPAVRAGIVAALASTDVHGPELALILAGFLQDRAPEVRAAALDGLRHVADPGEPAVTAAAAARLEDGSLDVRRGALVLLLRAPAGGEHERAAAVLEALLAAGDAELRLTGLRVLDAGVSSASARRFERAIRDACADADERVRAAAVRLLARIDPAAAIPALDDRSGAVREAGMEALASAGGAIAPAIEPRLESPEPEQRAQAVQLLWRHRPDRARAAARKLAVEELAAIAGGRARMRVLPASPATAALAGVLAERVRRSFDHIFQPLGAEHGASSPAVVRQSLAAPDARLRADALDVLEPIYGSELAARIARSLRSEDELAEGPAPAEVVREMALDPRAEVRGIAAHAYAELAPSIGAVAASEAIARLERDEDADTRAAAEAARALLEGRRREMLSIVERMILLKSVQLFESLTVDQLRAMAGLTEEKTFEPGRRIIEEGGPGDALYVIVSGRVAIEQTREGRASRLRTLDAPACFGEMSLFDGRRRSASVLAETDTILLELEREPVLALARRHPDLSMKIIEVLSDHLRAANERMHALEPRGDAV